MFFGRSTPAIRAISPPALRYFDSGRLFQCSRQRELSLALLVLGVNADDRYTTFAADHFALVAHSLY